MREVVKYIYMLFFHPVLFWRYSVKNESRGFFTNGKTQYIKKGALCLGQNIRMGDQTRISFYPPNTDKQLRIGDGCYCGNRNTFLVGDNIVIGANVLIASDVCITSENHGCDVLSEKEYMHQDLIIKPVVIGDGCWIGEKVVILPGVEIGEKTVIGAGSVVTKSIPPYSIAVGNPCRVIKKFSFDKGEWEKVNV